MRWKLFIIVGVYSIHILNCKFYYKPHAFENMVTDIMFYYRIIYLLELVVSDELCLVTLKD
jgi:hypothetical protein